MNIIKTTQLAAILLLIPLVAQAGTMSSPSYSTELNSTVSGSGNYASPNYGILAGVIGNAITTDPVTSSPGYSANPGLPAKIAAGVSTLHTGDVNGDNSVTIADALLALQISVGSVAVTGVHLKNGDVAPFVDGKPAPDGAITVADALMILRKVVGLVNW